MVKSQHPDFGGGMEVFGAIITTQIFFPQNCRF
jgi:hypothetical protein